jgi:hypothetical protein
MFSPIVVATLFLALQLPAGGADDFLDLVQRTGPDSRPGRPGSISLSGPLIDGRETVLRPWPIKVTLVSVDRAVYRIGEAITFEVSPENTGTDPVMIPWGAPADRDRVDPGPDAPPGYLSALIRLVADSYSVAYNGGVGSRLLPQSLRWLKPGEPGGTAPFSLPKAASGQPAGRF